ncbi:MAG: rhomboid family intramembrane serine protease [Gemmatimonadales bacterium]
MTPWVTRLLVANVAVFLIAEIFPLLKFLLLLRPAYIPFRPWTVVTYMFLHANLWHLFFNMLALFFFGPRLEARLGGGRFLRLYFFSGFMAAIVSLVATPFAAIIGASGAVFGVLLGFARYWPREQIYIWGLLPIEARWLVIAMTALSLWGGFGGIQSGVAHFAHLGGFLGGFLYLKWIELRSPARKFKRLSQPKPATARSSDVDRWRAIRREGMHPVNQEELDRLLSKIDETGVESLTMDERAFLDRCSAG